MTLFKYMKQLLLWMFFVTSCFTMLYAGSNLALTDQEKAFLLKHPVLTVHNEKNYPPYNFNKNDTPVGFSIDYMNLLAKKLGIKVKYISGHTWSEFMDMIREGKLDVMLNIRRTPQRDTYLSFTEPYAATQKAIFSNDPFLNDLYALQGKTVCVPKDFYIEYFLESYYPNIQLMKSGSLLDCMKSVDEGSSVATIGSRAIIRYLMQENNINMVYENTIPDRRLTVGLSIATAKNMHILRDILQKAMYGIGEDTLSVLTHGWLGEKDARKVLSGKSIVKPFKEKRVVTMCNNPNWAPIEYVKEGDESTVQGIAIDTLKLLEQKLNVTFKTIQTKSWVQSQAYMREGKCEILPAAIQTEKRKEYANFTMPYLVYRLAVITQKDKPFIENLSSVSDKIIARKRGSGLINKLKKRYPQIDILETKGYRESLKKVSNGEAYCTIATLPVASYYINKFALNNLYIAGYIDMKYRLSIAVTQKDKELLRALDAALSEITEYQHRDIYNKWVNKKLVESYKYTYVWYALAVALLIFLLIVYRHKILQGANVNLQKEIREKVEENIIQHQFIQEQAKLAALGEMIGVIAHQWRQPLNALGLSIQNLEYNYKDGLLDQKFIEKYVNKNIKTIKFMSHTIDDFRNFFKVDKVKAKFSVKESIEATFQMQSLYLEKYHISFVVTGDDFEVEGLRSEFQQVILNLISNAKDALVENRTEERGIEVYLEERVVVFMDNGGGISEEIMAKVFDSYFTTKEEGLGVGLYMSKIIIEEKVGGRIQAYSKGDGTVIVLDFNENEKH